MATNVDRLISRPSKVQLLLETALFLVHYGGELLLLFLEAKTFFHYMEIIV